MANRQIDVTLLLRNAPATTWTANNPTLSKGELGIETDTRKFKIGDGSTPWNLLKYANGGCVEIATTAPTVNDIDFDIGTIWADTTNQKVYVLFAKSTTATWVEVLTTNGTIASADKLSTARTFTIAGCVVSNSKTFNGTSDVTFTLVLQDSGVTAGTYTKVVVNEKGIITSASTLTANDIPALTLSKISDVGTAASKDVGTEAGNVPMLDTDGKLNTSVLPALAITETYTVASESAMIALNAQRGDVAIRTDEACTYILTTDDPTTASNWVVLKTPDCKVVSVNGKTGTITLTTSDIAEGTNLYYTETRATANFNTNFAQKSIADLRDGADALLSTDTLILNGGNA